MDIILYIFECLGVQFHELCIYIKMCLNKYLNINRKVPCYMRFYVYMYICFENKCFKKSL